MTTDQEQQSLAENAMDIQTIIEFVLNRGLMDEHLVHDRMDLGIDYWKDELRQLLAEEKRIQNEQKQRTLRDTKSPIWRWRRKDEVSVFHQFFGDDLQVRSRCGVVQYPILGQAKPNPASWQRCRSCDKMSRGLAGNAKTSR